MITTLLFDCSRVFIFPKDSMYQGSLNALYKEIIQRENFNFFDYFTLNEKLLVFANSLQKSFQLYMFTTDSIQKDPAVASNIHQIFRKIYTAKEIGIDKKDVRSYEFILRDLNIDPDNILFIDDDVHNITAARAAGLATIHFVSNEDLITRLAPILSSS